jgi:hypothetical protein
MTGDFLMHDVSTLPQDEGVYCLDIFGENRFPFTYSVSLFFQMIFAPSEESFGVSAGMGQTGSRSFITTCLISPPYL